MSKTLTIFSQSRYLIFHVFDIIFIFSEDLLGEDLGDHSLADYNLGNEEEEELLADDYDHSTSQNVPTSAATAYGERLDIQSAYASNHSIEYTQVSFFVNTF